MLFLVGIPSFLFFFAPIFDAYLALPRFMLKSFNFIIALLFIVLGFSFSAWSVWAQYKIGKGTPDSYDAYT